MSTQLLSIASVLEESDFQPPIPEGYQTPLFTWDCRKLGSRLKLAHDSMVCYSVAGNGFKTVLGNQIFTSGGRYYFQIFLNKGQQFKIGVARPNVNLEEAFCDTADGWAIYNGQLRHNTYLAGPAYGEKLKSGDVVGVALDMIEGTLSFYKNRQSWGVAFKDENLKWGNLVAAVSAIYSNDIFSLRNLNKED